MVRPRWTLGVCLAASALVLGACGTASVSDGSGSGTSSASAPTSASSAPATPAGAIDPVALIGSWHLEGTDEPAGTVLRLARGSLSLWTDCGSLDGSWRADASGLFVGETGGATGCQARAVPEQADWLRSTTRIAAYGDGWRLLDRAGETTVRLRPGATIAARSGVADELTDPPVVDAETRAWLAEPPPLPAGLRPASWRDLIGRWEPAQGSPVVDRPKPPYLQLRADGSWTASDGCNGSSGRWAVGPAGRVLATAGSSTLIGCQNIDLGGWWSTAGRAGFDADELVLVDLGGRRLVSLQATPYLHTMTHGPITH